MTNTDQNIDKTGVDKDYESQDVARYLFNKIFPRQTTKS